MTTSTVDFVMRGLELKHSETGKQKPQIKKIHLHAWQICIAPATVCVYVICRRFSSLIADELNNYILQFVCLCEARRSERGSWLIETCWPANLCRRLSLILDMPIRRFIIRQTVDCSQLSNG